MTTAIRLQVQKGPAGKWYFNLVRANGKVQMTSEMYANRQNAIRAAKDLSEALGGLAKLERDV